MGKILAVDWGWARFGLAVSDDLALTAHGLGAVRRVSHQQIVDAVAERAVALDVKAVVVGLPANLNGTEGPSAAAARSFAQALEERLRVPVHLWDERLTTAAAERTLVGAGVRRRDRRELRDQVAATLILQAFLDRQRAPARPEAT